MSYQRTRRVPCVGIDPAGRVLVHRIHHRWRLPLRPCRWERCVQYIPSILWGVTNVSICGHGLISPRLVSLTVFTESPAVFTLLLASPIRRRWEWLTRLVQRQPMPGRWLRIGYIFGTIKLKLDQFEYSFVFARFA